MNNQRRKAIKALYPQCEALGPLIKAYKAAEEELKAAADELRADIETIKEEEQEYIDNLPDNLQQSEKASNAEAAVQALEAAMEIVDTDGEFSNLDKDDIISSLDEATGY